MDRIPPSSELTRQNLVYTNRQSFFIKLPNRNRNGTFPVVSSSIFFDRFSSRSAMGPLGFSPFVFIFILLNLDFVELIPFGWEQIQVAWEQIQVAWEQIQVAWEQIQVGWEQIQVAWEQIQVAWEQIQVGREQIQVAWEQIQVAWEQIQVAWEQILH